MGRKQSLVKLRQLLVQRGEALHQALQGPHRDGGGDEVAQAEARHRVALREPIENVAVISEGQRRGHL